MASPRSSTNFTGMESMAENSAASPGCGSLENGNQSMKSVRDQDKYLPVANINRIMRKGVPQNGKIAKESKEFMQECVSEFVSCITSEAIDKCKEAKRKTVSGDDLLRAMSRLGFEHYINPIVGYMVKYREAKGDCKGSAKGAGRSTKKNEGMGGSARMSDNNAGSNDVNSQAHNEYVIASMQGQE